MRLPTPSYRSACASIIGATLLLPMAASGEEIRVLFVPSQDLDIEFRTRALERAIAENSHSVRVVKDLVDAHVLLQFTDYRVEHRKKDGPLRWWHGTAKVLLPAEAELKDAAPAFRLPERFALVIMGQDGGTEMERTAAALERFLRKALARDRPKRGGEAI
jgi:hypothetical protein